jgi:urease gamma subunit
MAENEARDVLLGISPMPENLTVEQIFADAHITVHVVTPF